MSDFYKYKQWNESYAATECCLIEIESKLNVIYVKKKEKQTKKYEIVYINSHFIILINFFF